MELKSRAIDLLYIVLEETNEHSATLAKWVIADLDQSHLVDTMKELWFFIEGCEKGVDSGQWNQSLFRTYHILRRIADHKSITMDKLSANLKSMLLYIYFFYKKGVDSPGKLMLSNFNCND